MLRSLITAPNILWTLIFLLCFSLVPFHWMGWSLNPLNMFHAANDHYLTAAIANNTDDVSVIAQSLAVLSILSSAEIGVDLVIEVDVTIGQALSSMLGALEQALFWSVAASVVLEAWHVSLGVAVWITPSMYKLVVTAGIFFVLAHGFHLGQEARQLSIDILRIAAFAAVLICIVLPISFYATGKVTTMLDLHQLLAAHPAVETLHRQAQSFDTTDDLTRFWGEASKVKDGLATFHTDVVAKTHGVVEYSIALIVFHVLHGTVFPLIAGYLVWRFGEVLFRFLLASLVK